MWTFRLLLPAALVAAALGGSLTHCVSPTNCLRYSDCDEGLTCAYGRCVVPMPPSEGGTDSAPEVGDGGGEIAAADAAGLPEASARDAPGEATESGDDAASGTVADATAD